MTITKTDLAQAGLDAVSFASDWRDPCRFNGLFALPGDYGWRCVRGADGRAKSYATSRAAERDALRIGAAKISAMRGEG